MQVPVMRPFPEKHSVLICDDYPVYYNKEFQDIVTGTGAKIVYLPPNNPHLNPVSLSCNLSPD